MKFDGYAALAGFSGIGLKGDVSFTTGYFTMTGYVRSGFRVSWKSLSLGYKLAMDVTLKYYEEKGDKVVSFRASITLEGRACVDTKIFGKICANITIHANIEIKSNGSFKVCFSIGIGKLGFDVCIKKDALANGQYMETMTYEEIPLEFVPLENRFEAERCD